MQTFAIYRPDTGTVVATVPGYHAFAERVIAGLEAGKHSAELVYDDFECIDCGTTEGISLNRHTDGELYFVCEPCHF